MKHIPKKSLGQNFLKSEAIVDKIIAAANLSETDTVLEIGPGKGMLTKKLLEHAGRVIAVEKDKDLISVLQESFPEFILKKNLEIIHGDILEFDSETIRTNPSQPSPREGAEHHVRVSPSLGEGVRGWDGAEQYKLIANIPYYITGAIIEKFLSASFQPSMMVLMLQKEVAERIVAKNKKTGNAGKESILSIAVKAYGNPIYISTVKAGNFVPAPSVDSAILAIETISRKNFKTKHHEEIFFQIVKAGFAHKRKTLAGNLKNILEPEVVDSAMRAVGLRPTARAEDVGISQWLAMSEIVYTGNHESARSEPV